MLEEYRRKRNFNITSEPSGQKAKDAAHFKTGKQLTFVIQKHAARALHYDFRLEVDGVMVSWAVPKGPSLNSKDRRLAVMTEDHPMEYSDFEGIIPEEQYGAGEVIIWDRGIYTPDRDGDFSWENKAEANKRMQDELKKGRVSFYLKGSRLEGSWALVKLSNKQKDWLLIKHKDAFETKDVDITEQDSSVLSGKTLDDLQRHGATRIWTREKGSEKADPRSTGKSWKTPKTVASIKRAQPTKPMKITNAEADSVIDQLTEAKSDKITLELDDTTVAISSLSKVYWPETDARKAITKRDLLIYLTRVSKIMIPHLNDRLLTLRRFPNGIGKSKFYQKHWEQKLPPFVQTAEVFTENEKKDQTFLACNNLATLLWLAQIADLEIHTSQTRIKMQPDARNLPEAMTGSVENLLESIGNYPDFMILDLDPYVYSGSEKAGAEPEFHKAGFDKCREIVRVLKGKLDALQLTSFIKTSGKTGLHIYVPIKRNVDYDTVRSMSQLICQDILKEHSKDVTMEWAVQKRTGKIFLDHNMNARSKSLVAPYSPRVTLDACVSTPIEWDELNSIYPTDFNMQNIPARLEKVGDVWKDILKNKNDLSVMFSNKRRTKIS